MKNFIIGYGETLTKPIDLKKGGGDKAHPYSVEEAKRRFIGQLSNIMDVIENKPANECANDTVVTKIIQHPSYLAKSYYPRELFEQLGVRDIGSKAIRIKPEKWGIQSPPEDGLTSCIYISATKYQYAEILEYIQNNVLNQKAIEQLRTIESIDTFNGDEKIKNITYSNDRLKLEVVLHASKNDSKIIADYQNLLHELGGDCDLQKVKTVGGLTFMPTQINNGNEIKLAEFSHLRFMRNMPKLRIHKPNVLRQNLPSDFQLPDEPPINPDIQVCIFDGGLIENSELDKWVTEIIPSDVTSSHPTYLLHGGEVCSTYLFGPFNPDIELFNRPYTNVDLVRVVSPDDQDPDLFDVLTRIESVLKQKKYKYINLSLGPNLPIDDDEVHVWTSVIDSLLKDGDCLITVAIGNDGDLPEEYARIQPPSDMVNSFAIGSSNSDNDTWEKASYSCIGPGRSPGLIKPDGVMFGGDTDNLFHVYSPSSHSIVGTMGTSYAAPYALRVAAGIDAITNLSLNPLTIKALMIHKAKNEPAHDATHVGWGRMPNTPEQVIECLEDEATIVYQGQLEPSQYLRIPIPLPESIDCKWVNLKATFCINVNVDPEHPLHYTRGGLDITFRPNTQSFSKGSKTPRSATFFSNSKLYSTEEELRDEACKWETSLSKEQRYKRSTFSKPCFDVKYHAREQGGKAASDLEPLSYSLIISIRTEGNTSLYNTILQENQTLSSVKVINQIQI